MATHSFKDHKLITITSPRAMILSWIFNEVNIDDIADL